MRLYLLHFLGGYSGRESSFSSQEYTISDGRILSSTGTPTTLVVHALIMLIFCIALHTKINTHVQWNPYTPWGQRKVYFLQRSIYTRNAILGKQIVSFIERCPL